MKLEGYGLKVRKARVKAYTICGAWHPTRGVRCRAQADPDTKRHLGSHRSGRFKHGGYAFVWDNPRPASLPPVESKQEVFA